MAILDCIQAAARELGLPAPSSVVSSTDLTTIQLLAFAHADGQEQRDSRIWPQLTKEQLITIVGGQDSYALPSDFDRHVFDTHWDRHNHWSLLGPISPQDWQEWKSGITSVTPRKIYRLKGASDRQFFVHPVPGASEAGQTLVFEYQSLSWVRPATWTTGRTYNPGSFVWYDGNTYQTTTGGTSGATPPTHTTGSVSDGGVNWAIFTQPYETFRADTDVSLLDERVLKLGIKWRFLQMKGLAPYQELRAEWQAAVMREATALQSAPVLSLTKRRGFLLSEKNIPETGYGS